MVEPVALKPIELPADEPRAKRNRFVFSGQFTPYKGTDVLLKAMALLGDDFDGHLWLYGANIEHYVPETQRRFRELLDAAKETVTFAGPYDREQDLTRIMMSADWVVVPSIWWETGPLTVMEAFQHGRPVICSDIGGMSEKVTDGVNGLHFLTGDAEDLAAVMQRAVDTPGLWDQLRANIPPVPDMRDHAGVISDVYRRVLARAGVRSGNGHAAREKVPSA
jgi:glycosyltransferase involved in cell wall biosynthesis